MTKMKDEKLILELPSERKSINEVEPALSGFRKKYNIRDDVYYNILIAFTEAVNNAIIHGNKLNVKKKVSFSIEKNLDELLICVSDEGLGFNPQQVADPRHPENILKDNGRGIFLIKELSSSVEFNISEKGSVIIMHFKI